MIRAIIYTAIGYWLSRQVFERYDLAKRKSDQERFKRRLEIYLRTQGWDKEEVQEAIDAIYRREDE